MPGSISSYSSCMTPSRPIRGRSGACPAAASALAVDVLVAVIERVDLLWFERDGVSERAREVHGAGDVLAHHGGLDRLARRGADGEDAVRAHQHRRGAMRGERLDDAVADLLAADQRERADRYRPAELVGH